MAGRRGSPNAGYSPERGELLGPQSIPLTSRPAQRLADSERSGGEDCFAATELIEGLGSEWSGEVDQGFEETEESRELGQNCRGVEFHRGWETNQTVVGGEQKRSSGLDIFRRVLREQDSHWRHFAAILALRLLVIPLALGPPLVR